MPTTDLWGREVLEPHEAAALMRALTGVPFYTMPELAEREIDLHTEVRGFSNPGSWRSIFAHILTLNDEDPAEWEDEPESVQIDDRPGHYRTLLFTGDDYDHDRRGFCYGYRDIIECEGCNRYGLLRNWVDSDEVALCQSCYEDCYYCDGCGGAWQTNHGAANCCEQYACLLCDSIYYSEDSAAECCERDEDDEEDGGRLVHDYGFKPRAILHASDLERDAHRVPSHYFGVEIEIEQANGNHVSELAEILQDSAEDDHYLKHDGSISNGVELVTHPRSLLSWQDEYESELGTLLERAAANGARAWNAPRCGLHVHVSRTAFRSEAHLYRFTKLAEDNDGPLSRFAGRRSEQWASFNPGSRHTKRIDAVKDPRKRGWRPGARYMAVNLTNEATVELRFYRPSLKVRSVVAAVELIDAMIAYTRNVTSNDVIMRDALAWAPFALFVTLNAATYPRACEKIALRVGATDPESAAE